MILRSGLFDADFYRDQNPDVEMAGVDPLWHFQHHGWREDRRPNADFDCRGYLQRHRDLAGSGENPLVHFIRSGDRPNGVRGPKALPTGQGLTTSAKRHWGDIELLDLLPRDGDRIARHFAAYGLSEPQSIDSLPELSDRERVAAVARIETAASDNLRREEARSRSGSELDASIVVPVFDNIRLTLSCIESIFLWEHRHSFEIIVADDASRTDYPGLLSNVPGLRVLRAETNRGFLRNCNAAAKQATGRHIVFLNNDTVVLPGWLDGLLDALATGGDVGLVGSRLLYPDGRLQEAGCVVWRDGTAWNYGRYDDPDDPKYTYVRDTDYCSGASIALNRRVWESLGGFDEAYLPAYCEDCDLAFRVRREGLRVLYVPASTTIHFEGATGGTDVSRGAKRQQVANQKVLEQRWHAELATHGSGESPPANYYQRSAKARILVCDALTPNPSSDSGSVDMFNFFRLFRRLGYEVVFVPENPTYQGEHTRAIQRLGVKVVHAPFRRGLLQAIDDELASCSLLFVARLPVAKLVVPHVRARLPDLPIVFDTVDLHSLRFQRAAAMSRDGEEKARADEMRDDELRLIRECHATLVVSSYEADLLREICPQARVVHQPLVRDVAGAGAKAFEERCDIGFIGSYQHAPNPDAVTWFVAEIWPLIRDRLPGARFLVAGSDMDRLSLMADETIERLGHVEDLSAFFSRCRLTVAPLRFGAGTKGKVVSSLSNGVPVVATSLAAEGMALSAEQAILVADDPQAFADKVCALYQDGEGWRSLSAAGLSYCERTCSFSAAETRLQGLFDEIGVSVYRPPGCPPSWRPGSTSFPLPDRVPADGDRPPAVDRLVGSCVSARAETQPEVRVEFGSRLEWEAWKERFSSSFDPWRNAVVGSVMSNGVEEPLSGRQFDPTEVVIGVHLRESLSVNQMNSRKRALLLEIERLIGSRPDLQRDRVRIFAPEALGGFALTLRGQFPFFLGSEYLPDEESRRRQFPIPHIDLMDMALPNESFDIVFTSDVLEHVPDIDRALEEMARVLKPGGHFLSTFPFRIGHDETLVLARAQDDGAIEHLVEPQYHQNPIDPAGGSLVFCVPGWDILDRCRAAGLESPKVVLSLSAKHGIASSHNPPGILLVSARKPAARVARHSAGRAGGASHEAGPPPDTRLERLVGVVGLPRSGTTAITALLAAHSDVSAVYEPWNGKDPDFAPDLIRPDDLARRAKGASTLVIKETFVQRLYVKRLDRLIAESPLASRLMIAVLRHPLHCYLSEIQGRREWWGADGLSVGPRSFLPWARRSLAALAELDRLADRHETILVNYDALVQKPEAASDLMVAIGLPFEAAQRDFHRPMISSEVRGDLSLVRDPRPLTAASHWRRSKELRDVRNLIEGSDLLAPMEESAALIAQLPAAACAADHRGLVSELSSICEQALRLVTVQ